ncbi:MAG: LysR substrate-binding domain-containing protein, partial [Pseudomonadota bacterium]
SRRISQLERRLGTKLVERAGNATTPTALGRVYFEQLARIAGEIETIEARVRGENATPSGLLRVTAAIDFGQEHLTDWLLEFRAIYPDVEFDLILASGAVDLVQNNIDVAIRVGELTDSRLLARKLAEAPRVLVAAPSYLARRGTPETPAELEDHEFVFFSPANRTQPMVLIDAAGKRHEVQRSRGVAINAVRSAVKAVTAGQGVHGGPLWAFDRALAAGDVVTILPDYRQPSFPLYAVRQPSTITPERISRFIDFLAGKIKTVNGFARP